MKRLWWKKCYLMFGDTITRVARGSRLCLTLFMPISSLLIFVDNFRSLEPLYPDHNLQQSSFPPILLFISHHSTNKSCKKNIRKTEEPTQSAGCTVAAARPCWHLLVMVIFKVLRQNAIAPKTRQPIGVVHWSVRAAGADACRSNSLWNESKTKSGERAKGVAPKAVNLYATRQSCSIWYMSIREWVCVCVWILPHFRFPRVQLYPASTPAERHIWEYLWLRAIYCWNSVISSINFDFLLFFFIAISLWVALLFAAKLFVSAATHCLTEAILFRNFALSLTSLARATHEIWKPNKNEVSNWSLCWSTATSISWSWNCSPPAYLYVDVFVVFPQRRYSHASRCLA